MPSRSRPRSLVGLVGSAAVLGLIGCHALVDFDYEIDGASSTGGGTPFATTGSASASAVTSGTNTTAAATTVSTVDASSASTGPLGECQTPLFHVTFDAEPLDYAPLMWSGGTPTRVTTPVRNGEGAYAIALDTGARARLTWDGVTPGEEYWVGFSVAHLGPMLTQGTQLFSLLCSHGNMSMPPYLETNGFGLELDVDAPNFPFFADGESGNLPQAVNTLDQIQEVTGTYQDWIAHFVATKDDTGFFELFHTDATGAWQKVFRADGQLMGDACVFDPVLRFELSRWQEDPPPQTVVFDDIRVIRVTDPSVTENDYLYSLDPDSSCAAEP